MPDRYPFTLTHDRLDFLIRPPSNSRETLPEIHHFFGRQHFWRSTWKYLVLVVSTFACCSSVAFCQEATNANPESSEAKSSDGAPSEGDTSAPPLYRFESGFVTDWLVLGPIKRGNEPEDPATIFGDLRVGESVTFPNGQEREWKEWKADRFGMVNLGDFARDFAYRNPQYKDQYGIPDNTVCYAYCEVETSDVARQLLLGMDDGGRVWLDGELIISDTKPDWLMLYEHTIPVPETDAEPIGLMIELHNYSGGYQFACYGGVQLSRRIVYDDSFEPVADEVVRIRIPGEAEQITTTDREGIFRARALPFHVNTQINCLSTTLELDPKAFSLSDDTDAPQEIISVARTATAQLSYRTLDAPAGRYVAAAETSDGVILLANDSDHTIYIYNGGRVYAHPNLRNFTESRITCLATGPDESVWIGTQDQGIYYWAGGTIQNLDYPVAEGDEKRRVVSTFCPLSKSHALVSLAYEEENITSSSLYRIESSGKLQKIDLPDDALVRDIVKYDFADGQPLSRNEAFEAVPNFSGLSELSDESEIALFRPDARPLVLTKNGVFSSKLGSLRVTSMVPSDGKFWFAGQSLYSLDQEGNWGGMRWPGNPMYKRTEIFRSETFGLLAVYSDVIYSIENDVVRKLAVPAITEDRRQSCLASNGKLVIASGNTGVLLVERDRLPNSGGRGFLSGRAYHVSASNDQVAVSTRESELGIIRNGILTKVPLGTADDGEVIGDVLTPYVCVKNLPSGTTFATTLLMQGAGQRINTTLPVYLKTGDQTWKALRSPAWTKPVTAYFFATELLDGRIIVGSSQGMAELKDNELIPFQIDENVAKEGGVAIMDTPDGTLWMVDCRRNLIRLKPGGKPELFPIPINEDCTSTILRRFRGQVYIGTHEGLFRFDEAGGIVAAYDPAFAGRAIADLRTDISGARESGAEFLWIVTRNAGIRLVNSIGELCPVKPFETATPMTINGCDVDSTGTLWIATETGAVPFRPTDREPKLTFDRTSGEISQSTGKQVLQVACNESFGLRFATLDDSDQCAVRYRAEGSDWKYAESIGNLHTISLHYPTSGSRVLEVQAIDGEWNMSPISSLTIRSYYPFYQHPATRALLFTGALTLVIGLFFALNRLRRARLAESKIREILYEEEQRARQHAEEASREREMLLARVCHDLRNPLGVVLVATDLYSAGQSDRETIVKLLRGSTDSMRYLTDQLLNYAKLRKRPEVTPIPCNLSDFSASLQAAGALRVKDLPVEFKTKVDPQLPTTLKLDREMVAEVLNNLIENAVKHTEQGSIMVSLAARGDGRWQAEVRDTGSGIDEAELKTVFEPFYRGELDQTKKDTSVGLGLFIARELSELMDGHIEMSSTVGEGTSVRVVLPLVPIDAPPADSMSAAASTSG